MYKKHLVYFTYPNTKCLKLFTISVIGRTGISINDETRVTRNSRHE